MSGRPFSIEGVRMIRTCSEQFQRAGFLAKEEARRFRHVSVGVEHLLLGILAIPDCQAACLLGERGVDLEAARSQVEALLGFGPESPVVEPNYRNPSLIRILQTTILEAVALKHDCLTTIHLLLAITRNASSVASLLLDRLGFRSDALRLMALDVAREDRLER